MEDVVFYEIIGFAATAMTTGSLIPQVMKIYKTKDVTAISLPTYFIYFVGTLLWIAYGMYLNSVPIHVSNFFGFFLSLAIITMKRRYNVKLVEPKLTNKK